MSRWGIVAVAVIFALGAGTARADDAVESAEARLAKALERKVERSNSLRAEERSLVAPTESEASVASSPVGRWTIGAGGFALLLLGAAVWLKRSRESRLLDGGGIGLSIQDSIWVGKGQRLLVISAGGQRFLLGATGGGLETLAELGPIDGGAPATRPDDEDDRETPLRPGTSRPATFKDLVTDALGSDGGPQRKRQELLESLRSL